MTTNPSWTGWQTEDELHFLAGLSTWCAWPQGDRMTLLRRYREAMAGRTQWGAIDPAAIAAYLRAELPEEE